jgi:hypothetical protein
MHEARSTSTLELTSIAIGMLAAGVYFLLVAAGVFPLPGGPRNLHAPLWMVGCIGVILCFAGAAFALQMFGRADRTGGLAPDAPQWMRTLQYLLMLAIFICFGLIGSWIAFGPGIRRFSGSLPFIDGQAGSLAGRLMFGLGAVLIWLCVGGMVVAGARKLFGRNRPS